MTYTLCAGAAQVRIYNEAGPAVANSISIVSSNNIGTNYMVWGCGGPGLATELTLDPGRYYVRLLVNAAVSNSYAFDVTNQAPELTVRELHVGYYAATNGFAASRPLVYESWDKSRYGWFSDGFLLGLVIAGWYWLMGFVHRGRGPGLDV